MLTISREDVLKVREALHAVIVACRNEPAMQDRDKYLLVGNGAVNALAILDAALTQPERLEWGIKYESERGRTYHFNEPIAKFFAASDPARRTLMCRTAAVTTPAGEWRKADAVVAPDATSGADEAGRTEA